MEIVFEEARAYGTSREPVTPDDLVRLGKMLSRTSVSSFGGQPAPWLERVPTACDQDEAVSRAWWFRAEPDVQERADRWLEEHREAMKRLAQR